MTHTLLRDVPCSALAVCLGLPSSCTAFMLTCFRCLWSDCAPVSSAARLLLPEALLNWSIMLLKRVRTCTRFVCCWCGCWCGCWAYPTANWLLESWMLRPAPKFWAHQTKFYYFCDRSVREKAWCSRKRVAQAT